MISKTAFILFVTTLSYSVESLPVTPEPCNELSELIPDPQNCSQFYECTLGGWVGEACGANLYFNPTTLECDYRQNVKCPNDTISNAVTLEPCDELSKLIPDPQNCSRFYECALGGWVGEACGANLYFNPTTLECDYRQNVKCPNDTISNEIDYDCGDLSLNELGPNPFNCNQFIQCAPQGLVIMDCPAGLQFNIDTLVCDYEETVNCSVDMLMKRKGLTIGKCDEENLDKIIPDPVNCERFLQCSPSGWESMPCAEGLRFNSLTKLCDYPEHVACH